MILRDIQEDLVKLYLRLNGYFATGLIIHSPNFGSNLTELDTVAVRFPFHCQSDRQIICSDYLQIPNNGIDVIIAEVKSGTQRLQFNSALRESRIPIEKLISWLGAFDSTEIEKVIEALQLALTPKKINTPDKFQIVLVSGNTGSFSIRPIIFSMDRLQPKRNQPRYISGQMMLDFVWDCFRPNIIRQSCSTEYDLNLWGHSLLPIVEYFKDPAKVLVGNITDYYNYFGFN